MLVPAWKFALIGASGVSRLGRSPLLLLVFVLLPAVGDFAWAGSYRVAERSLTLDPPASYCLIDRKVKAEAELYRFMVQTNAELNRVLAVFVDCADLQRWRAGELLFLERYGNILTPIEETAYPGVTRGAFLAELRKAMNWALPLGIEAGQARIEATVPELTIGQSESLGIIEADEAALYGGIAQRLEYEGRSFILLGIFSMTLIKDVPLSVNLYRPLQDQQTVARLISAQRRFLQQLLERNRNPGDQGASPATPDPG
jgi:hypothetical protein